MDFLLARESLEVGDFNASANSPSLNLHAMHVRTFDTGVDAFAIAKADATARDRVLVQQFLARVSASATSTRSPKVS